MKNNAYYLQLKIYADANNFTSDMDFTKGQLCGILGISENDMADGFFGNLKHAIKNKLQQQEDEVVRQQLRTILINNPQIQAAYPAIAFEGGRENGSRYIKVWLDAP